jgi:hypothetical protein
LGEFKPFTKSHGAAGINLEGWGETVSHTYLLSYLNSPNESIKNTDINQAVFCSISDKVRRGHGEKPHTSSTIRPMGIHAMNRQLITPEGRMVYGKDKTTDNLGKIWEYLGHLTTNLTHDSRSKEGQSAAIAVAGRIRMANLTISTGIQAKVNDCIWLVPIRKQLPASLQHTEEEKKYLHYWCYEYFICDRGSKPCALVCGGNRVYYIGLVTDVFYSDAMSTSDQVAAARSCMNPTDDSDSYKAVLPKLGQIVVQLAQK